MKYDVDPEFFFILREFKKRLFHGRIERFAYQKWGKGTKTFKYDWKERPIQDQDFVDHFYRDYIDRGSHYEGALGFPPLMADDIIKKITFDLDDGKLKQQFFDQVAPKLDGLGIEWIIEHGGDDYERGHVSILTDAHSDITTAFLRQFFGELGEPLFPGQDEKFLGKEVEWDEVYGANKLKENLRFIYAFHMKRMKRFHLTTCYGEDIGLCDETGKPNPVEVVKAFNSLKILSADFMKSYIKEDFFPPAIIVPKINYNFDDLVIDEESKIPLPTKLLPRPVEKMYENCQALAGILDNIYNHEWIERKGKKYHDTGLAFAGTFRFYDIAFGTDEGRGVWDLIKAETRFRSDKEHHWWYGKDKDPSWYVWTCQKYDKYFGMCDGCKYRGIIGSPRDLIRGKKINKVFHDTEKYLVTLSDVREKTFPEFRADVKQSFRDERRINYALRNKMGTGKSFCAYDLISEIVNEFPEAKIMFSVHEGAAAISARDALDQRGVDSFLLMSHAGVFGHQSGRKSTLADFDCPYFDEIQEQARAGVLSSQYKSEFCDNCPLANKCHYPSQYSDVMDEEHRVVIIQHAHLSCQEAIWKLMDKGFNFLIIDENFLQYTSQYIDINQAEIDLLEGLDHKWAERIVKWLKGEENAYGKLDPHESELKAAYKVFQDWGLVYRLPDLIRFYNQRREANETTGIEVVYELPWIPIKIFLDGTMPLNLIKHLTGIDDIKTYGDNEIIDIEAIHPGNMRIQIYDISNSVTKMNDPDFFNLLMDKLCSIVKEEFWGKKFLFTCYGSQKDQVKEFVETKYPEILPFIDIGLMNRGTNKWAHFDGQAILAGRYMIGKDYKHETYRLKTVANYYREKKGLPHISNGFPIFANDKTTIPRSPEAFKCLMKVDGILKVVELPDIIKSRPKRSISEFNDEFWHGEIYDVMIGDMEQCERVRTNSNRPVMLIHCHGEYMPDLAMTHIMSFQQFLARPQFFDT